MSIKAAFSTVTAKTKQCFVVWLLFNLSLFVISGFMTKFDYGVARSAKFDGEDLYNGKSFYDTIWIDSKDAFFPFPGQKGYNSEYYSESGKYGYFANVRFNAFELRFYDWTELLVYTLVPLLGLLVVLWLKDNDNKKRGL